MDYQSDSSHYNNTEYFSTYIPIDRRLAIAQHQTLPRCPTGTALLADISGFTPLTKTMVDMLGPRKGVEELIRQLNEVYEALITHVHDLGGSVISFIGDAITCWFDHDDGLRAGACGLAMQDTIRRFHKIELTSSKTISLNLKVGLAIGPVRRFRVGDPGIQYFDVLAGSTLELMTAAEKQANSGEVVIANSITPLTDIIEVAAWRYNAYAERDRFYEASRKGRRNPVRDGEIIKDKARPVGRFGVIQSLKQQPPFTPWPVLPRKLTEPEVRPWVLPPVLDRLQGEQDDLFLAEIRPTVALFMRFDGLDYADELAEEKLDVFIRWVQHILLGYDAYILQLTIDDRSSFLYAAFGAPIAYDDAADRAVAAAIQLHHPMPELDFITSARIGLSQGRMRTGAYGASTRRTYGVLGNEVNIAARLMDQAEPGQILVSRQIIKAAGSSYSFKNLRTIWLKGFDSPLLAAGVLDKPGPTPQRSATVYTVPLVGREKELAYIDQILVDVLNGVGHVLCLQGPAGVGKSRLAAEVVEHTLRHKFRVAVGMCQSITQTSALHPWRQIMPVLFELNAVTEDAAATSAQQIDKVRSTITKMNGDWLSRLPLLRDLLDLDIPDSDLTAKFSPQLRRNSLLTLSTEIILGFANSGPLLLLIEDAQWLDEISQELVLRLGRSLADKPILLLIVQRMSPSSNLSENPCSVGPCSQSPRSREENRPTSFLATEKKSEEESFAKPEMAVETITLLDLSSSDVAAMAANRLGGQISPLALDLIQFRAQGNPFFVEEVVNTLCELGHLYRHENGVWDLSEAIVSLLRAAFCLKKENQQWVLEPHAPIATLDLGVPDTIYDTVLARIDRLPQAHRMTLKTASVIGRVFDFDLLYQTHPTLLSKETLLAEIEALLTRDLIHLEQSLPHLTYMFKHNITQEVAYETLLSQQRDQLHRRVGEVLEQLQPEAIEQLAYHYSQTTLTAKTLFYVEQAAYKAQQNFATETALAYFNQALALEERREWLKGKIEMLHLLGRRDDEKDCLKRFELLLSDKTENRGEEQNHTNLKFTVAYLWGKYYEAISDYANAKIAVERALTIGQKMGHSIGEMRCLAQLGLIARRQGDYETAQYLYNQALNFYQEHALNQTEAAQTFIETLIGLGTIYHQQGLYNRAQICYQQALELSRQNGNKQGEADVLNSLGVIAFYQRHFALASAYHHQALLIRQAIGDQAGEGSSLTNLAKVTRDAGDYNQAQNYLDKALMIQRAIANRWEEVNIWIDLGGLYYELGELCAAQTCLEDGLRLSREIDDEVGQAYVLCNLGLVLHARDEQALAEKTLIDALHLAQTNAEKYLISTCFSYLSLVNLQIGRLELAAEQAQTSLALRCELDAFHVRVTDDLATLAAIHLKTDDLAEAVDYIQQALSFLEPTDGEGAEFPQRTYFIAYQVLTAAGQTERAWNALQAAYDLVMTRADKITESTQRRSFLEQRAMNREIVAEYEGYKGFSS